MTGADVKEDLHRYMREARAALLGKLDGLSGYDAWRPLVPTGTNLLGLIKRVAAVTAGYFGEVFDRPSRLSPYRSMNASRQAPAVGVAPG